MYKKAETSEELKFVYENAGDKLVLRNKIAMKLLYSEDKE